MTLNRFRRPIIHLGILAFVFLFLSPAPSAAGERMILQLKDFTQSELKSGGFILSADQTVHLYALGGGGKKDNLSSSDLYAYGWIIDADSRKVVWEMSRSNTKSQNSYRKFDNEINLKKGSYEVYFAGFGYGGNSIFSNFYINIDRRNHSAEGDSRNRGFFNWLEEVFFDDYERDWKKAAKSWEISVYIDEKAADVPTFNVPKELQNVIFKAVRLGDDEHLRQRFSLKKDMQIRVYAIGEKDYQESNADYGWIIYEKTRERAWEFKKFRSGNAGGADKNIKTDETVTFKAGDYSLFFITDDSHSFDDWNSAPPDDPFNYGITLCAANQAEMDSFKLLPATGEKNIIAQLIKVGDDESRSASFALKEETPVRVYALGERANSKRKMADYGWIINSRTREKIWTMNEEETEQAGGDEKNRMVDELITLPKGSYTLFYQTDDSHAYGDWNSSPPFDPEHWGITLYGEGEGFSMDKIEKRVSEKDAGIIAQIVRVGDDADKSTEFRLDKRTEIRIYAIGEGQNREMYDYGWIEDSDGGTVWEMSYGVTFHAGGGRKNRSVNSTITLEKGRYTLRYLSDDSHCFNDWNQDPPDDPAMWGITLYYAEK